LSCISILTLSEKKGRDVFKNIRKLWKKRSNTSVRTRYTVIMAPELLNTCVMLDFSHFFPVTLSAKWQQDAKTTLSPELNSWLYDANSLTARLKASSKNFNVVVLGQREETCSELDACDHIQQGEPIIVREVLLFCDEKPQVFARSLMPMATLTGDEAILAHLGNKPLGQMIFNSPYLKRGDFSIASFDQQSSVMKLAKSLALPKMSKLWGRRSIFFLHGKPLAVAEVFLPQAFAYQNSKEKM